MKDLKQTKKTQKDHLLARQTCNRMEVQLAVSEAMDKKNMNELDLSRKAGVSQEFISAFFREGCNPSLRTLTLLAHALDCDLRVCLK